MKTINSDVDTISCDMIMKTISFHTKTIDFEVKTITFDVKTVTSKSERVVLTYKWSNVIVFMSKRRNSLLISVLLEHVPVSLPKMTSSPPHSKGQGTRN